MSARKQPSSRSTRALALCAAVFGGCIADPDYTGTSYLCPDNVCPDGFSCVDGVCELSDGDGGEIVFVDDELDGEFGDGTFSGTEWSGSDVRLASGVTSGEFLSRVFDAEEIVSWDEIEWVPDAPYGKPLVNGSGSEPGYRSGAVDMMDNALLLHLDPPGLLDSSDNVATIDEVGTPGPQVQGLFDEAVRVGSGYHLTRTSGPFDPPTATTLDFGTENFTWALWVNTAASCGTEQTFVSSDAPALVGLVCADTPGGGCSPGSGLAVARVAAGAVSATLCGGTINDDQWHHLAVVKRGHASATVELYVDGQLADSASVAFVQTFDLENETLGIGANPDGSLPASADLDELAIWGRALSTADITSLYRRGVVRLELDMRSCSDPACATASAFDLEEAARDDSGGLGPPVSDLLFVDDARYAQYRCRFTTVAGQASPAVSRVSLAASGL